MADCPYPWCKFCKTTAYAYANCPNVACKKCHTVGHWPDNPICPKYQNCKRCGGPHLAKACDIDLTKTFALSSAKPAALNLTSDIQQVLDFMDGSTTKDKVADASTETAADPAGNDAEDTNDGTGAGGESNGGAWGATGGDGGSAGW